MKKLLKIVSVALTGALLLSTIPAVSVSAATKKATISTANTSKGMKISWKKSGKNTKYTLSRSTKKSSGYKKLTTTKKLTFTDKTAKNGKSYYYKVTLSTGKKYSAVKATKLKAPTIKSVTLNNYDGINIQWSKVTGATKYKVYRAKITNGKVGKYTCRFTTKKTTVSDDLYSTGTYCYKVTAVNGNSESLKSATKKINYVLPSYLTSTVTLDRTGVELDFTLQKNIDGYKIYRYEEGKEAKTLTKLATIKASAVKTGTDMFGDKVGKYTDATAEFGKTYVYGVQTYKGKANSIINYTIGLEYTEADIIVTVGEQSSDLADTITELEALYGKEFMSFFTFTCKIDDETIATVDDDFVITGVSAGKTIMSLTLTFNYAGMTSSETIKSLVLVKEAATVE